MDNMHYRPVKSLSWTILGGKAFLINEEKMSVITLEDGGTFLWGVIIEERYKCRIVKKGIEVGLEARDIEDALESLKQLGVLEELQDEKE